MKIDGLKLSDLKNIDPRKLDTRTLRSLTQKLASAANKRLKRLEESGLSKQSPAYKFLRSGKKHKGKVKRFSTSFAKPTTAKGKRLGKNYVRNKALKEWTRAYDFLFKSKTGTIAGAKRNLREIEKRFPSYFDLRKSQRKEFWDAYNRLLSTREGEIIQKKGKEGGVITSDEAQRILYDDMFGDDPMDAETALSFMQQRLEGQYELLKEREAEAEANPLELSLGDDEEDTDW